MNIALLMAGGVGLRMFQNVPKQFLTVFDKPIMIYTLEAFQKHPDVEAIVVPCLDGWHEILWAYAKQFNITKLKWIVPGGENGQASIRSGVFALREICTDDDIVLVHDAIRPMVSAEIISDCIVKCRRYGSGLAAIDCRETVIQTRDGIKGDVSINRAETKRVQTPQAYRYDKLLWAHEEALRRGVTDAVSTSTIMIELGESIYFALGSEKNFKITDFDDIDLFKAFLLAKREGVVK
jgi:2-C-methyl-D-erythritol 4-phosphate cytidylyltransferase